MKEITGRIVRPCGPYTPELNYLELFYDNKQNRRAIAKREEIEIIDVFKREDFKENIDDINKFLEIAIELYKREIHYFSIEIIKGDLYKTVKVKGARAKAKEKVKEHFKSAIYLIGNIYHESIMLDEAILLKLEEEYNKKSEELRKLKKTIGERINESSKQGDES